MDLILNHLDEYYLDKVYPASWGRSDGARQLLSLFLASTFFGYLTYFITAGLNYHFVFDKRLLKHQLFLKNQVSLEISMACRSLPVMGLLSALCFWLEVRGYSRLHSQPTEGLRGILSVILTTVSFITFTDALIYWIHRWLHSPYLYAWLHKDHHKWKVTTPWASHAFHPLDGFLQSAPYHIYVFLFPMNKIHYLILFGLVNIWTVSIHDGNFRLPSLLRPIINGSAHHADHHRYFKVNYGQYFTLWDRIGGSFRDPDGYADKRSG